jgi:hypothetical protein
MGSPLCRAEKEYRSCKTSRRIGASRVAALYDQDMGRIATGHSIRHAAAIALSVICAACQSYVPLTNVAPASSANVRVTLSERASLNQYGAIGSSVRQIEGAVRAADDSTLLISVRGVTRNMGFSEEWAGDLVSVPRRDIVGIEEKRISFPRTLATVGAFVAGSLAAHSAIAGGDGTTSRVNKPGNHN